MDNGASSLVRKELESRLLPIRAALQRTAVAHGLGQLVLAASAAMGVVLVLDATVKLPVWLRVGLLCAAIGLCLGILLVRVIRPLLRRYQTTELAALVELTHPELQERLLSSLELASAESGDANGSPLMREWLFRQTVKSAEKVEFTDVIDARPAFRAACAAAVAVLVLIAPFLVWRDGYTNLWARFFNPWGNYARGANLSFDVRPGDCVLPRGEDVTITAVPHVRRGDSKQVQSAVLSWTNDDGQTEDRALRWSDEQEQFIAVLPQVLQGFRYQVEADGGASREFQIRVVDRPAITSLALDVEPPAYCGRPAQHIDGAVGEIKVFEQSRLSFSMRFNGPVTEARWLWVDDVRRTYDGKPHKVTEFALHSTALPGVPFTLDDTQPLKLATDRTSATWEMTADREGSFEIILLDAHGIQNRLEPARTIRLIVDAAPTIAWTDGSDHPQAKSDDVLSFGVMASDDLGLAQVELHYSVLPTRVGEQVLEADAALLGGRNLQTEFALDLRKLLLPVGSLVSVKARAVDERQIPGPNEAWTSERIIAITKDAQPYGANQLADRHQQVREALRALRKEANAREKDVGDVKQQLLDARSKELAFDLQSSAERQRDLQESLAERVEQLSALLTGQGLLANLAAPLEEVAKNDVHLAAEQTQQAPATAADQQPQKLEVARKELHEADDHLAQIEQKFEELAKLEKDLLELNRLADRTDRLAADVSHFEQKQNELAADPAIQNLESPQRKELEEDRDELLAEQQELTSGLQDLLNRRPELTEAARADLLERLKQLAERGQQLAEKEDQLAAAMRAAGAENAAAMQEPATEQRVLRDQVERLAAETELSQRRQVVPPLDLKAVQQALADLEQGNANAAVAAQEQAADDLEKLAKAFAQNEQLPADPQAAARELSRRQQELRDQFAQAAQKSQQAQKRQGFDPDARQQDLPDELKDAAAEQAAIQAAAAQLDVPLNRAWRQNEAVQQANDALRNLLANAPQQAAESAERARQSLETLANEVGAPEERSQRSLEEARNLKNMQAGLARQLDDVRNQNLGGQQTDEQAAEQISQQAAQQTEIARRTAALDTPQATESLQRAVQDAARSLATLQAKNPQDAAAAAHAAEKSLAEVVRSLEGKPQLVEEAEQLRAQQAEVVQSAKQALDSGEPEKVAATVEAQRKQAEGLRQFDAAGRRSLAEAAVRAADDAASYLDQAKSNPQQRVNAEAALERAQQAVEQLAGSLPSPKSSAAEQAQSLAARQDQEVEASRKRAEAGQTPRTGAVGQQSDQQLAAARELSAIPSGPAAAEKKAAAQSLQQAQVAQEKLAQLVRSQQPANPSEPAAASSELAEAMQQSATAQQSAAESLRRFADRLAQPDASPALANLEESSAANAVAAREPSISDLEALAEKADGLAELQKEAREKAQPLADGAANPDQRNNQLGQAREAQNKVSGEVRQLGREAAPDARASAQQHTQFASDALGWDKPQRALAEQQAAEADLRQLARQARNQASLLQESAEQQAISPGQSAAATPEALADQAHQLAVQQRALAQQMATRSTNAAAESPATSAESPMAEEASSGEAVAGKAGEPSDEAGEAPESPPQSPAERARNAVARQQQVAEDAMKFALEAAASAPNSPAAATAREVAEQAAEAAEQASLGNFDRAQAQASQGGETSRNASDQLEENPPAQGGAQPELAHDARRLAEEQGAVASELKQLSGMPAAQHAAQAQGQSRIERETAGLKSEFQQLAGQLKAQPVDRPHQSQQAAQARERSSDAAQSMRQAARESGQGNSESAARSAKQAADALRQSSAQAQAQPSNDQKNPGNPVPNEVGSQVTEAQRQLQRAAELLAKGPPSPGPSENGSQESPGQQPGEQAGEGQNGELAQSQSKQSEPGEEGTTSASGSSSGGQGAQSASQSLREGAQALRQAAKKLQLRPGQKGDQSMAGQPGQTPKQSGPQGEQRGANESPRIADFDAHLKAMSTRNWGQLPGTLQTEILQSTRRRPDGDYAKLIKLYFEEISRGTPAESVPEEQGN